METKTTHCFLCIAQCKASVNIDNNKIINVRPFKKDGSKSYACPLLPSCFTKINDFTEITSPLKKVNGEFVQIGWDQALLEIANHFKTTDMSRSLHFHFGSQNFLETEFLHSLFIELGNKYQYTMQSFERGASFANARHFPTTHEHDLIDCDVVLCIGKNLWVSNSYYHARTAINNLQKSGALITVDPVRTETAERSKLHIQIKPGTDLWFILAIFKMLKDKSIFINERANEKPITHFFKFLDSVPLSDLLETCNINQSQLDELCGYIQNAKKFIVVSDLGLAHNIKQGQTGLLLTLLQWLLPSYANATTPGVHLLIGVFPKDSSNITPITKTPLTFGAIPAQVIPDELDYFSTVVFSNLLDPVTHGTNYTKLISKLKKIPMKIAFSNILTESTKIADYVFPVTEPILHSKNIKTKVTDCEIFLNDNLLVPPAHLKSVTDITLSLADLILPNVDRKVKQFLQLRKHDLCEAWRLLQKESEFTQDLILLKAAQSLPIWNWSLVLWNRILHRTDSTTTPNSNELITSVHNKVMKLSSSKGVKFPELMLEHMPASLRKPNLTWLYSKNYLDLSQEVLHKEGFPFILSCGYRRDRSYNNFIDPVTSPWVEVFPEDAVNLGISEHESCLVTTEAGCYVLPCRYNPNLQSGYIRTPMFKGANALVSELNAKSELNPTYKFQFAKLEKLSPHK